MAQQSSLELYQIWLICWIRVFSSAELISLGPENQWEEPVSKSSKKIRFFEWRRKKKKIVFRGPCNFIASKKPPHSFVDSSDVTWGRYPGTGSQRRRLNEGGWAPTTLLFNPRIEKTCIRPMGELRAAVRRPIANRWWLRKARGRRGPRS